MVKKGTILTTALIVATAGLIYLILPEITTLICFALALLGASYFWISVARKRQDERVTTTRPHLAPSVFSVFLMVIPVLFAGILLFYGVFSSMSIIVIILLSSLAVAFFYYFMTLPLAIYNKSLEVKLSRRPLTSYPVISVLVPAYNEETCIARTIETILDADYPHKDIIVIDDGSTDKTYDIAIRYKNMGIKVLRRPNGGKFAALNYGLLFARGEIIVIVDADSLIARNALKEIAKNFQDKRAFGVAGNIKVWNRTNLLTKCQALEYIVGINIFRRAFDVFGVVSIVPGALGAFRKDVVEKSGFYDPYTLTEDFDITIKILKAGGIVQSCDARAYTQAPPTLKDTSRRLVHAPWFHHISAQA